MQAHDCPYPPQLIVLEGGEGAGKSTNTGLIAAWLQQAGIAVELTREPGGTPVAEALRQTLLTAGAEAIEPLTELLLMFAARNQHLQHKIRPSLQAGRWVLCDRFVDASYAYQGAGRGLSVDIIGQLEKWVVQHNQADWVIVLDIPPAQSRERVHSRGKLDRFEQEQQAFFERVRECYRQRAAESNRYSLIDASLPLAQVQALIRAEYQRRYPLLMTMMQDIKVLS
jgi:dTMP kinase